MNEKRENLERCILPSLFYENPQEFLLACRFSGEQYFSDIFNHYYSETDTDCGLHFSPNDFSVLINTYPDGMRLTGVKLLDSKFEAERVCSQYILLDQAGSQYAGYDRFFTVDAKTGEIGSISSDGKYKILAYASGTADFAMDQIQRLLTNTDTVRIPHNLSEGVEARETPNQPKDTNTDTPVAVPNTVPHQSPINMHAMSIEQGKVSAPKENVIAQANSVIYPNRGHVPIFAAPEHPPKTPDAPAEKNKNTIVSKRWWAAIAVAAVLCILLVWSGTCHFLGVSAFNNGEYAQAVTFLKGDILFGRKMLREARFCYGAELMDAGRYQDAADVYEKLGSDAQAEWENAQYALVYQYCAEGKDIQALELLATLPQTERAFEADANIRLNVALQKIIMGDYEAALQELNNIEHPN